MKSFIRSTGTLLTGLILTQVSAQNTFDDPTGLNTLINTNNVTFMQDVGNINVAGFNALGERVAFTFEAEDGYSGTSLFNSIILLENNDSPMNLRVNFGSNGSFRQRDNANATGGVTGLAYASNTTSATIDFVNPFSTSNAQPVTGVAFTANRIISGNMTVSLFSDLARTQQIGSTFTINDNNASGGSNHSFFGFYDGNASIASVVLDTSDLGQFWIDDLNITTIPEPSSLILMFMGLGCLVGMQRLRKRHA